MARLITGSAPFWAALSVFLWSAWPLAGIAMALTGVAVLVPAVFREWWQVLAERRGEEAR